jgi:hypothetical protein
MNFLISLLNFEYDLKQLRNLLKRVHQNHNAEVEVIQKYDPALWENYNIIAPNEAIRSFEL